MAAAMWSHPSDPSIYGVLDIDATPTLTAIDAARSEGVRLTVTHVVARAIALTLRRVPAANCKVRWGGRIAERETVDVFVTVATEGGRDLAGLKIDRTDEKSLARIAEELGARARGVRDGGEPETERGRSLFKKLPPGLTRPLFHVTNFLVNDLELNRPAWGMPADPFGSAVVTNVGTFGVDMAFAPFVPLARSAVLLLVPEIRERPFVENGVVVAKPVLRICATFDHRIVDGSLAGKLAKNMREFLADPRAMDAS